MVDNILFQIYESTLTGHPGRDRSLSQARRSYFWLSMKKDIFSQCARCHSCAANRLSPAYQSPSLPCPIPSSPLDAISIDLLKLPFTQNGFQYIFVSIDNFSRFTIRVPLKDKNARFVVKALIDRLVLVLFFHVH